MRRLADATMQVLARLLVHVFFRRVEVEHGGRLPLDRPVLLVANHTNGLVDGLLLISSLRRYPRFLGKSTLFRIPPLWPLLKLAGVVPVYRAKEGGNAERNAAAFRTSRRFLAGRGVVAIFPEGISHNESTLQPLRTGAGRIALGAAVDEGTAGVTVVPVGLIFDAKARFRSRALVRVGEPFEVDAWADAYRSDDRAAVRELTAAIDSALRQVSPDYESWRQAALLGELAEVAVRWGGDGELASRARTAQALAALEASSPAGAEVVAGLRVSFEEYQRDLALMGLTDAQLSATRQTAGVRLRVAGSLLAVVLTLPFAVAGFAVHIVPYQIMKVASSRVADEGIKATVKLFGCTVLFTAVYVTLAVLAGERVGALAGLGVVVACPAFGYATVRIIERARRLGGLLAGHRVVRDRGAVVQSVVERRAAMVAGVRAALTDSA